MALLNDILAWSQQDLPLWQQDALRRLLEKPEGLTEEDYDELYILLQATHGLLKPPHPMPVPLAAEHLPGKSGGATPVILCRMYGLQYVNRVAPDQELVFATKGMTIVYGGNGSGKSGYSRVLKRACRARDQGEDVLTDATDSTARNKIPEAMFDVQVGNTTTSVKWIKGAVPPDALGTIAVFDIHCARSYLSEGEVAYLPYGLDIVENLANKVIPEVSRRLDQDIDAINVDRTPFAHLIGETEVGKLVGSLSSLSDSTRLVALATLSEEEKKRITELSLALSEPDPGAKAKELRLSAGRLKGLVGRMDAAKDSVADTVLAHLREYDENSTAASDTERKAAEILRTGEGLLPGTGDAVWKSLFDAARRFSTECAYPGHSFPYTENGAKCPFCQQPIADVVERLNRFDRYIQEDASRIATEKKQLLAAAREAIERTSVTIGIDSSLLDEITLLDEMLAPSVQSFQASLTARRAFMLRAVESHLWDDVPAIDGTPRQRLRFLAARQIRAARIYDHAADESKSRALKDEYDSLRSREQLALVIDSVVALIDRMKLKASLSACRTDLQTKPISDKSKVFANGVVTKSLKAALDREFGFLGIGHIKTKLKERNDKGKMKYRLTLDFPSVDRIEAILSEGEQRAISIGSFLAELSLAQHLGAIVFDDPVSSLDHHRRQYVAQRLVAEASHRQVVIFTHDTSFLGELLDAIEQSSTNVMIHHLEWINGYSGYVKEGLPWEHLGYKERLDKLEQAQRKLEKNWPAYPSEQDCEKMRHLYSYLRATIERVIQDIVFNGVIKRYRDWIRVDGLDGALGYTDADCKEISRLHKICCNVTEAHDPPSAKSRSVPTPGQLRKDLASLEAVVVAIKARRKS